MGQCGPHKFLQEAHISLHMNTTCGITQKRRCLRQISGTGRHRNCKCRKYSMISQEDILQKVVRSIRSRLRKLVKASGAQVKNGSLVLFAHL